MLIHIYIYIFIYKSDINIINVYVNLAKNLTFFFLYIL